MQNTEPSVEFDTVANKKQQHEINVGKRMLAPLTPYNLFFQMNGIKFGEIIERVAASQINVQDALTFVFHLQQSQIHLVLVVTTLLSCFLTSSHESA